MIKPELVKFLMVGGFSAAVNILSRIVFDVFVGFMAAVVMAFFVALTTAFLLNKFWVFQPSKYNNVVLEYLFFLLVNLLGLVQTVVISLVLLDYFFPYLGFVYFPATVAHAVGVVIPAFTSFIGHKYLSFRQ